jgi:hypothetical protein
MGLAFPSPSSKQEGDIAYFHPAPRKSSCTGIDSYNSLMKLTVIIESFSFITVTKSYASAAGKKPILPFYKFYIVTRTHARTPPVGIFYIKFSH